MILLDPDLDPGPRPKTGAAKRSAGSETSPTELRIPSPRALAHFLKKTQAAVRLRGQVSVLLTTDRAIRKLNRQFRGKNKATDVLSFPAMDLVQDRKKKREKGDLAISVETARRQGAAHDHSLETEIKILVLHGLLHLAGYDHERDAGEMAREEHRLRARLGLEQGLLERANIPRKRRTADPSTPSAAANSAQDDRASRVATPTRNGRARSAR